MHWNPSMTIIDQKQNTIREKNTKVQGDEQKKNQNSLTSVHF